MQADKLQAYLRTFSNVAIAFSGGVDSALLLAESVQALGTENVLALTAVSPTLAQTERAEVERQAAEMGVPHRWVPTQELEDADFCRNDARRCYYCKRLLFQELQRQTAALGMEILLEGSNADDDPTERPGAAALAELGIPSPLRQFGYTKAEIRAAAARLKLSAAAKPSTPCLATRLVQGLPITRERLQLAEQAERALREVLRPEGNFRVRIPQEGLARVVLETADQERLQAEPDEWERLAKALRRLGFHHVTLDPQTLHCH